MTLKNTDLSDDLRSLPPAAQLIFHTAFAKAGERNNKPEDSKDKTAWAAVKAKYKKGEKGWELINPVPTEETLSFEAEVFSVGTWKGDKYTASDLDDMVQNFSLLSETIKPPLKLGHRSNQPLDGQPAIGWVDSLRREGTKLLATFRDVPHTIGKALKQKRYKRVSSEIYWNYKQGKKLFKRVLSAVALLGADIPAVENLADIDIYLNNSMKETRTYTFNTGKEKVVMDDELKYKVDLEASEIEVKKYKADLDTAQAEVKKYKEKAEAIELAALKVKQETQVTSMKEYCEAKVKAGAMLPAQRDILVGGTADKHVYAEGDTAKLLVPFDKVKGCFDLSGKVIEAAKEEGVQENSKPAGDTPASFDLHLAVKKYIADNPKASYAEAAKSVLVSDSGLADRYREEK